MEVRDPAAVVTVRSFNINGDAFHVPYKTLSVVLAFGSAHTAPTSLGLAGPFGFDAGFKDLEFALGTSVLVDLQFEFDIPVTNLSGSVQTFRCSMPVDILPNLWLFRVWCGSGPGTSMTCECIEVSFP